MQTTTLKLTLPRPHKAQQEILNSPARNKVLDCGRRVGKTELFVNMLLTGHSPSTSGALAGLPVAYISLSERNVKELWRRLLAILPDAMIVERNASDFYLKLITGGLIECWTFNNFATARGRAYAGIILDEAAQTANLKDSWEDVFIATLADFKGWGVVGSTPMGFNFFHDLYTRGDNPDYPGWESFKFTTYDNPHIDPDEIDHIRNELPVDKFNREYLAEFAAIGGGVFGDFEHAILCEQCAANIKYDPTHRYVAGIDWGRENDYTVLSIIDKVSDQEVYIERWRNMKWDSICRRIAESLIAWHVEKATAEYNSIGAPNMERLESIIDELAIAERIPDEDTPMVLPYTMTNDRKTKLTDELWYALHKIGLLLQPDDTANMEMRSFVQKLTSTGKIKQEAAGGGHDDTVIARLLSWYTARNLF
jgi:hypothetical protein